MGVSFIHIIVCDMDLERFVDVSFVDHILGQYFGGREVSELQNESVRIILGVRVY